MEQEDKIIKLRGHHLLLLLQNKFLDFLSHEKTDEFLKKVSDDTNAKIKVIGGYDDVCSCCKRKGNECSDKINEFLTKDDLKSISDYGLKLNSVYSSSELLKILYDFYQYS